MMLTDKDTESQYQAALTGAALFDRSLSGKIEVHGQEAPDFLHNLSTNDVKGLPLGGGCEAFFCNERARSLFHARIYHVRLGGLDAMWIDVTPDRGDELLKHLDRHLIAEQVELADVTDDFAQFHVAGPKASEALAAAMNQTMPPLELHQHMEREFGVNTVAHIRRHDPLGVPGFDVVCLASRANAVQKVILNSGAVSSSETVWDCLRIEAGTPEFGKDFDEKRFVVEINRPNAISFTKGCYLGQEPIVMARDRAGFVNRSLRGLRLTDSIRLSPGEKLFAPDEVGAVTSSAVSPGLGPVALGYLRRGFDAAGTVVHVGGPDGPLATIADLPMSRF